MLPSSSSLGSSDLGRRRSQRVILSVAIRVRTEALRGDYSFDETTNTLLVNAHGALILLAHKVEKGQMLHITNSATHLEHAFTVAHVGPPSAGKTQVGVEFISPSPDFWRIAFPPENWIIPDPDPATH